MAKSKQNVLVVEDDPDLNDAFRIVLDKEGYEVDTAFNGQEALDQVKRGMPDLILLDLLMPVMGGEQFLKELNQLTDDSPPVVVFTNLDTQNEIQEVKKLGAERYLLKAWAAPSDLVKVVKDTLAES